MGTNQINQLNIIVMVKSKWCVLKRGILSVTKGTISNINTTGKGVLRISDKQEKSKK